jgi:hypothetical protein
VSSSSGNLILVVSVVDDDGGSGRFGDDHGIEELVADNGRGLTCVPPGLDLVSPGGSNIFFLGGEFSLLKFEVLRLMSLGRITLTSEKARSCNSSLSLRALNSKSIMEWKLEENDELVASLRKSSSLWSYLELGGGLEDATKVMVGPRQSA